MKSNIKSFGKWVLNGPTACYYQGSKSLLEVAFKLNIDKTNKLALNSQVTRYFVPKSQVDNTIGTSILKSFKQFFFSLSDDVIQEHMEFECRYCGKYHPPSKTTKLQICHTCTQWMLDQTRNCSYESDGFILKFMDWDEITYSEDMMGLVDNYDCFDTFFNHLSYPTDDQTSVEYMAFKEILVDSDAYVYKSADSKITNVIFNLVGSDISAEQAGCWVDFLRQSIEMVKSKIKSADADLIGAVNE